MRFSIVRSASDPASLRAMDQTVDEITAQLTNVPQSNTKDGLAIIPATFTKPYRATENVSAMTMLGLDMDALTAAQDLPAVTVGFLSWGWQTWSHTPGAPKLRVLIPFAEPLPVVGDSWHGRGGHWERLMSELGFAPFVDKSTRNPDRLYYTPRSPLGEKRLSLVTHGPMLDWRDYVKAPDQERAPAKVLKVIEVDPSRVVTPEDWAVVQKKLDRYASKAKGSPRGDALARVLKGQMPTPPPEIRSPGQLARNPAWLEVTYALALCAPDWAASEALAEFLREAWSDEVRQTPMDYTEWETVVGMLKRARPRAAYSHAKRTAFNEELESDPALKRAHIREQILRNEAKLPKYSRDEIRAQLLNPKKAGK
jgi:hypothetical protein